MTMQCFSAMDDLQNIATIIAIFEEMIYDPSKRTQSRMTRAVRLIQAFSDDYERVGARLGFLKSWIETMVESPSLMMECKNVDPLYADFMECARQKNRKLVTETPLTDDVLQQKLDVAVFKSRVSRRMRTDTPNIECANCMQCAGKTKKCSGCKIFFYCDEKCQDAHWAEHRRDCAAVRLSDLVSSADIID